MCFQVPDQVDPLHAGIGSGAEAERLADHLCARELLLSERAIGFEDELHGLTEVRPGFLQGGPLGVGPRKFLDEGEVSLGNLTEHGGELDLHGGLAVVVPQSTPTSG